jgi:hypothetical protein
MPFYGSDLDEMIRERINGGFYGSKNYEQKCLQYVVQN